MGSGAEAAAENNKLLKSLFIYSLPKVVKMALLLLLVL